MSAAIFKTPAFGLLQTIKAIVTGGLLEKYWMMLAALVPAPEAKRAILILLPVFIYCGAR